MVLRIDLKSSHLSLCVIAPIRVESLNMKKGLTKSDLISVSSFFFFTGIHDFEVLKSSRHNLCVIASWNLPSQMVS